MKRVLFLSGLILLLCAACAPAGGQPVYSIQAIPSATSIPLRSVPSPADTFAQPITSFDVSPDARLLAIALRSGVQIYDLHTYRFLRRLSQPATSVTAVAWSPDGSKLAVGGSKDYGKPFYVGGDSTNSWKAHLTVYDTAAWKVSLEPEFDRGMVNQFFHTLTWSPDGRSIAFSTDISGVELMDVQTGRLISQQTGFAGTVVDIAWAPDGSRLLATGDMAYSLRRWRVSDNQSVRLFDQRMTNASSVAWSPDGKRIASGDYLGNVCLWTAATNRCNGFIHAHFTTFDIAWSPDGTQLATAGGIIRIWDTRTGRLVKAFGEDPAFSYDRIKWPGADQPLVTLQSLVADPANTLVRLWDMSRGSILAEFRGQ